MNNNSTGVYCNKSYHRSCSFQFILIFLYLAKYYTCTLLQLPIYIHLSISRYIALGYEIIFNSCQISVSYHIIQYKYTFCALMCWLQTTVHPILCTHEIVLFALLCMYMKPPWCSYIFDMAIRKLVSERVRNINKERYRKKVGLIYLQGLGIFTPET